MRDMAHANEPANAQPICCMPHQLPSGSYPLKKHDELQLEEDDRINRGATSTSIRLLHELPHKGEVECALQVPIEMIVRDQAFK